jgi:hypothetical protein
MDDETRGPNQAGLRRDGRIPRLVSVVIPAFNAAEWLDASIASVRAQAYQPIEVIVADDGSSDATASKAEALGARVVRTAGAGPGGARNAGIEAARGEFLQFLDADDMIAPGKIARQVGRLSSTGGDVAWEPYHHLIASSVPGTFEVGRRVVPALGDDLAASLLSARGFMQIGCVMIRRSARTDHFRFVEGRDAVEDVRYLVALAMQGARFESSDAGELGLLFRQHDGPRHSARPVASFARGCAANAMWAEAEWSRAGGLTSERRVALGEAYAFAARQLAAVDPATFRDVAERGLAHGDAFLRHLPSRMRWLTRVVGYERAESIAVNWRRARYHRDESADRPEAQQ